MNTNAYTDFGFVTAGEMHRIMREHPEMEFELRVDAEEDGEEAEVWSADAPEFQNWNDEQIPTDDFQRPLRLQGRAR